MRLKAFAIFVSIFYLLFSIIFSYAQEKEEIIEEDIGTISSAQIFKKIYEIKKEIISAVSLCDCTQVAVAKKGGISVIEVEFNPAEYDGPIIQEIKLLDKDSHIITLKLKGYVDKSTDKK